MGGGHTGGTWSPKRLFPSHHEIPVGRLSLHSLTASGPPLHRAGTITELISAYSADHETPFREGNGKLERSTLCTHRDADHIAQGCVLRPKSVPTASVLCLQSQRICNKGSFFHPSAPSHLFLMGLSDHPFPSGLGYHVKYVRNQVETSPYTRDHHEAAVISELSAQ